MLFVAEKVAALEVVHRRLLASGLGDAALELHSHKSNRRSVVAQLGRAWDRSSSSEEEQWIKITDKLKISRDQLNAYVEALHSKGSQGFSVFEAIGSISSNRELAEKLSSEKDHLSYESKDAHDKKSYEFLIDLSSDLGRIYEEVKGVPALSLIDSENWSHKWQDEILNLLKDLCTSLEDLQSAESKLAKELGLCSDSNLDVKRCLKLKALAPRMESTAIDLSSVPDITLNQLSSEAQSLSGNIKQLAEEKSKTKASYPMDALDRIPLESLDFSWREARTKIWPLSALQRRKVRKILQTYSERGKVYPELDLEVLLRMCKLNREICDNPMTKVAENQGEMDADYLMKVTHQAVAFRKAKENLRLDVENLSRFEATMAQLSSTSKDTIQDILEDYLVIEKAVDEKRKIFILKGGKDPTGESVTQIKNDLTSIINEKARLPSWLMWVKKRKSALKQGLNLIVKSIESGYIEGAIQSENLFRCAYASWWLPHAMDASDELRGFTYWNHENTIETFRKFDDEAAQLVPRELMRRIHHKLPFKDDVPKKSELGTLRHQLNLERPSIPIRKLLSNMPETFGKLAPCVLMSPLSVSQYLPTGQATFDVVIFDEASQIPTWDGIGVISRARQAIIVGDPKQLPPTNFFGRADNDDEELPEIERDMPSILDEVATAGVPTYRLNWHYRSQDESLIAFSNQSYYNNRLITFPAPFTTRQALKIHEVKNGVYKRGKGRVNEEEARAIVEMIIERLVEWLSLPEDKRYTLGVITFNSQQQSLILDLLDEARRKDNRLDWFFDDKRNEPVIVKNLENIQGDERDVILFSVTFGPDLSGKLTMNFGPLNNAGGEKRLNVAITRARRELHIFSSIRPDQIDLGRTRARGVHDLKAFLDYASRGPIALSTCEKGSLGPAESPFEESVLEALRDKGWEVRTQIGVSGFRIDLGVVNPRRAGAYLAGIECDGAQYHSSATARDRDKVRQAVLEGMGWKILRIWSTNWFRDKNGVINRIHDKLEKLLQEEEGGIAS